ncbi:MAG: hypothetical protein IH593_04030, partial [Bacteroidales bacterium]|nr:hypothetical protein [Bacteroidales bacterium]
MQEKDLNCGTPIESTYLRYLAISSTFQAPASAGRRAERLTHTEESFKHKLFSMFSQPGSVPGKGSPDNEPHINYAYVESRNERSRNLVHQAGYEYIRSFLTLAFSRFNP